MSVMIAGYHQHVAPIKSFAPFGGVVYAITATGINAVIIPADHILWSEQIADAALWLGQPETGKQPKKQLWILGDFSTKAEAELQALGWELHPDGQTQLLR